MAATKPAPLKPVDGLRVFWSGPMPEWGTVRASSAYGSKKRNLAGAPLVVAWDDGVMFTPISDAWWARVVAEGKLRGPR